MPCQLHMLRVAALTGLELTKRVKKRKFGRIKQNNCFWYFTPRVASNINTTDIIIYTSNIGSQATYVIRWRGLTVAKVKFYKTLKS